MLSLKIEKFFKVQGFNQWRSQGGVRDLTPIGSSERFFMYIVKK